jgi:hypothetical protein
MFCCLLEASSSGARADALAAVARACSPRVEPVWNRAVIFDAAGLERAIGPPEVVACQVSRLAVAEGLTVRVAIAARMTAAWLLANASADPVVAVARPPADSLADLSLEWLETLAELDSRPPARPQHGRGASRPRSRDYRRVLSAAYAEGGAILRRWGLRTMGELARLNPADIHARLGPAGTRLHRPHGVTMPGRSARSTNPPRFSSESISSGRSKASSRWPSYSLVRWRRCRRHWNVPIAARQP